MALLSRPQVARGPVWKAHDLCDRAVGPNAQQRATVPHRDPDAPLRSGCTEHSAPRTFETQNVEPLGHKPPLLAVVPFEWLAGRLVLAVAALLRTNRLPFRIITTGRGGSIRPRLHIHGQSIRLCVRKHPACVQQEAAAGNGPVRGHVKGVNRLMVKNEGSSFKSSRNMHALLQRRGTPHHRSPPSCRALDGESI